MPIPTYIQGFPPDGSSLGQTKVTIRNNIDGTFQTLGIDHTNNNGQPGSQPAGYHTIIHEVPQTSVSTSAGYNQVFSGVPGTLTANTNPTPAIPPSGDQQLYALSGGGILYQLTGALFATPNGYAWAGGLLFQWGRVTNPAANGSVNFSTNNVKFPNNCFSVMLNKTSAIGAGPILLGGIPTASSFSWSGGDGVGTLFWVAIGN